MVSPPLLPSFYLRNEASCCTAVFRLPAAAFCCEAPERPSPHPERFCTRGVHLWHSEARNRQNETQPWSPLHSRSETQDIGDEYDVFPPKPKAEYDILRHSWVFGHRKKPHVPVLQGTKLPSATTSPNDSARSFSLFLRPWVFCIDKVPRKTKGNE